MQIVAKPARRIRTVEGSCWACREHRVKCKLQKPNCSRCLKKGLSCEYGKYRLKWGAIVAPDKFGQKKRSSASQQEAKLEIMSLPLPRFNSDSKMMYFQMIISPRLTARSVPWDYDSLKFASKDTLLKDLIDAMSCAHFMVQTKQEPELYKSKQIARVSALKNLSSILQLDPSAESKINPTAIFRGSVLLGLLDGVIEPDSSSYRPTQHINGGRAILDKYRDQITNNTAVTLKDKVNAEIMSVFATMDLTYSLLTGSSPYFKPQFWFEFGSCDAWWGNVDQSDPFLEIMSILTTLAVLGHSMKTSHRPPSMDQLLEIQERLAQFILPARSAQAIVKTSERSSFQSWSCFCSAYANTAMIYCLRALWSCTLEDDRVQCAVSMFVDDLISASNDTLQHCLLFPLLIAGYHTQDTRQRDVIRSSCMTCYGYLFFGSIRLIIEFLEERWARSTERLSEVRIEDSLKVKLEFDLEPFPEFAEEGPTTTWWDNFEEFGRKTFVF
ncbi:unnamed protein product [Kuraishia capsulata CBS 1993]|uniref:Zn(2)-C6 fungal-type domain-containing protein n=1 Tax=Kuraishia capsulata CBS 1993 TaxID=1382522 RepID=W6MWH0_9ASCO|nr:uncharacterized protein KUCA_T00003408001 [Kuraishia capsulata CBS 1993]CDK27430.1 unnamed protein product [Kuraishia capsulata CBS 1993]